jgi:hypothetical protein
LEIRLVVMMVVTLSQAQEFLLLISEVKNDDVLPLNDYNNGFTVAELYYVPQVQ